MDAYKEVDYHELLQNQTPEQRNIQRLEWRWARRLPKWERATLRVQVWVRGCMARTRAKQARAIRDPLLESRRLYYLAKDTIQAGHFQVATELVSELIERHDSTYWPAYSLRGWLRCRGSGDIPGALQDLAVCIRNMPLSDTTAPLKMRGRIYVSQGRWEEASRDFSAALRMDPQDLKGYILRGNALIHTGNCNGAMHDFSMVIDRAEVPSANDYIRRACVFCCGQNWQRAIDDLSQSLAIHETAQAFSLRGRVHACMRQWKSAVDDYDAALQLDPMDAAAAEGKAEAEVPYVPLPMLSIEDAARIAAGE